MNTTNLRVLPACLLAAFSGSAAAAGFQLWEQNASGIATSFAGSAVVADNAGTIYYNPAGLALLPGLNVSLGVAGNRSSYEFRNQGSSGTGALAGLSGGNGGDAGQWTTVPNGAVSWQVAPQWFVGLGISTPFGLSTEYEDSAWVGRFNARKADIQTVNVNPSVAYKLSDRVSLGFGINYQKIDVELTRADTTGLNRFKGDDSAWGWNAGALFTLSPAMRVGVSYRSAIDYSIDGSRSLGAGSTAATADLKLPGVFILSVWQQVSDRWEAMGDLSYTDWSNLGRVNVRFAGGSESTALNFRSAWRFAWGAAYKADDAWKIKFGISYDRSAVPDGDRSAWLPDNNRIGLSLGGQWKPSRTSAVDFGYAYLWQKNPTINQTSVDSTGATANLRGRYDAAGHLLGIQYSQGF